MSVKHSLLALLAQGDRYGAQLKQEFEERTDGVWPLNIGQIYTTLDRLAKAGLVESTGDDGEGRILYRLTDAGRAEATAWFTEPVPAEQAPRSEVAMKLALAVTLEGVDAGAVIRRQREAAMEQLQELTRRKAAMRRTQTPSDGGRGNAAGGPTPHLAAELVLERLIYTAESELRWLDHVALTLARRGGTR